MNRPRIEAVASAPELDHAFTRENLPWFAGADGAGGLDDATRRRIEAHVAACDECRAELAQQQRLVAAMQATPVVELAPHPGLAKLMQRIDTRETRRARWSRWLLPLSGERAHRPLVFTAAIQAFVIVVLMLREPAPAPSFRTLSNAPPAVAATAVSRPHLRVVFDGALTLAQIAAMLEPLQARIVDGPRLTSAGSLVTLSVDGDAQAALAALRGEAGVQFAELVWD